VERNPNIVVLAGLDPAIPSVAVAIGFGATEWMPWSSLVEPWHDDRFGREVTMLQSATLALRDILSPPFRGVLIKSLALTIGLLAALWVSLQFLLQYFVTVPWPWLDSALGVLTGIGLLIGLAFLVAPVTALFAGLFLDDVAEVVERTHYSADPVGLPLPLGRSIRTSLRFLGVVLLVNAVALPLVLLVGFGFLVFLVANAWLLGREYFELAALRHHDATTVRRMRTRNAATIFAAGLAIAAFIAIPVVNLSAPLFATAVMVHLHKRLAR
jgi:CysZ protein